MAYQQPVNEYSQEEAKSDDQVTESVRDGDYDAGEPPFEEEPVSAATLNEKEEIFKLKCKLNEYEKQNSQLKQDTDRLNRRCAQLSMAEMQTTHELGNLKLKIQQVLDQYAELDRKFNDNLSKLKLYEQRDEEKTVEINRLKDTIERLTKNLSPESQLKSGRPHHFNGNLVNQIESLQMSSPNSIINQRIYLNSQSRGQAPMASVIQQLKRVMPISGNTAGSVDMMNGKGGEEVSCSGSATVVMFQGLNRPTPMLDNEPSKFKSSLIKRGSLASRHLPQQQGVFLSGKNSQGDDDEDETDNEDDFDFG